MNSPIYLDIGNTNVKWKFKDDYFEMPIIEFSFDKLPNSSKIWVSNVSSNFCIRYKSKISVVESQKKYKSLVNSYKEPKYLGSDRWLAMIASYEINPRKSFLVVDIGTAVTFDFVNNSGKHLGGVIFPGLLKIRNTFDHFAISKEFNINELSQSTQEAWSSGTLELVVNGINQKIHDIKQREPDINIFLTGGGFHEVKSFLNFSFDYHKNLVLDGLELFVNNMG